MKLWAIHPQYLDTESLITLWHDAQHAHSLIVATEQNINRYPQLRPFIEAVDPLAAISSYLKCIHYETRLRGCKLSMETAHVQEYDQLLNVTVGQLDHELITLKKRLKQVDSDKYHDLNNENEFKTHPLFMPVPGAKENWPEFDEMKFAN